MPSANWFSKTLYRKNMSRFWPLWAGYGVIWFFILPVSLLLRYSHTESVPTVRSVSQYILGTIPQIGIALAVTFGLLAAMAVWSYLYNSRPSWMIHALPVRREGLFLSNWLAGMSFLILPNAAVFLLALGAQAVVGAVEFKWLLLWFLLQSLLSLFFFSLATICAFFTGHIVALPALYVIFNGLAQGMGMLAETVLRKLLYGYGGLSDGVAAFCKWCTPVYGLSTSLRVKTSYSETLQATQFIGMNGIAQVLLYGLVGIVFSILALLLYRKRALELAGEVIAVSVLQPVFKYGVAFCGALAGGTVLYAIFQYSVLDSPWILILFLLLCGAVAYYIAEILLKKSFRVIRKSWRGGAVFLAVLAVCAIAVELDVFGFETRMPDQDSVAKVSVDTGRPMPYDSYGDLSAQRGRLDDDTQEGIQQALALQRLFIDQKDRMESGVRGLYTTGRDQPQTAEELGTENAASTDVTLTYTLNNGKTVIRSYKMYVCEDDLTAKNTPAGALLELLNRPKAVEKAYFPDWLGEDTLVGGSLDCYNLTSSAGKGDLNGAQQSWSLDRTEAKQLYQAVREDMEAGRIGSRWLLSDKNYLNKVYDTSLCLTFYGVFPQLSERTVSQAADVSKTSETSGATYVTVYITPRTDSSSTLAALENLGALDSSRSLLTQYERMMMDSGIGGSVDQDGIDAKVISSIDAG